MNIFVLASSIVLVIAIAISTKKQKKNTKDMEQRFWARERQANSVRRKSLDSLNYIHIPLDKLPLDIMNDNPEVEECQALIRELSTQTIVNLTGYTNTDLKLEYGTANITILSEYDQNYTILVRTLQQWADALLGADYVQEARVLMEFAVSTGTDISRTYYKLADIYASRGENYQIEQLIAQAQELRTSTSKAIVRTLQESYQ